MKAIREYVRKEWYVWIGAFLAVMLWCVANSAFAAPVLKAEAFDIGFYHDVDTDRWYVANNSHIAEIKETFDDVKVVWKGKFQNRPLVLIAGQQGQQCEMVFRLYWFKANGDFTEYKNFNTCYAKKVDVNVDKYVVRITLDDKVIDVGTE